MLGNVCSALASTFYIYHGSVCSGALQPHVCVCVCVSGGLETSAEGGGVGKGGQRGPGCGGRAVM